MANVGERTAQGIGERERAVLSNERTARREDGGKVGSQELQMRRSDSFMTPMPGAEATPGAKGSPDGEEIPKCKLAFEEVYLPARACARVCPRADCASYSVGRRLSATLRSWALIVHCK